MILKPFVPGFLLAVVISSHSSSFLNQPQNLSLNTSQTELFFMSNIDVIFFLSGFQLKKQQKKKTNSLQCNNVESVVGKLLLAARFIGLILRQRS